MSAGRVSAGKVSAGKVSAGTVTKARSGRSVAPSAGPGRDGRKASASRAATAVAAAATSDPACSPAMNACRVASPAAGDIAPGNRALTARAEPDAISASPKATTSLVPKRFVATMATGDSAPVTTANGSVATPARSGA